MNLIHRLGVPVPVQAAWFRNLARLGIHVHPRDAELVARFHGRRDLFESIRTMLSEDSHLAYVGHSKTRITGEDQARTPENPGIPPERWNRYRQLMREAGLFAVSHVGDSITMRVSTCGSSCKGIVHSPAHRVVVSSLERYPLPPEQHAHLILDEPWYVFYGWDS
jgi:hypothetical protein